MDNLYEIKKVVIYKPQEYERVGLVPINEVIEQIWQRMEHPGKKGKVTFNGYRVNVQSTRLRTFALTGVNCSCCKIEGAYFAIERSKGNTNTGYHLNLWAKDKEGKEVLMTHDHITARGLGGVDDNTNTETMCGPCNWEKGQLEQQLSRNPTDNSLQVKIMEFKNNKEKILKEQYGK